MKLNKIYSILLILLCSSISLFALEKNPSNRIAVVVNQSLKAQIETNLDIYLQDLRNEGYDPILIPWSLQEQPSPQELKDTLIKLYKDEQSLQGSVMIGDLPIPLQKVPEHSYIAKSIPSLTFVSEMYYMSLIPFQEKAAQESNNELVAESVEKLEENILLANIWVSHLVASPVTKILQKTEPELINAYLEKNHAYRTGQVIFSKNAIVLPVAEEDKTFDLEMFDNTINILKNVYNVEEIRAKTVSEFLEPFYTFSPEIAVWGRHGEVDTLLIFKDKYKFLGGGSVFLGSDVLAISNSMSGAFVFPRSCNIGQYTAEGYFAGVFLFNPQFFSLAMPTTTISTYGGSVSDIMLKPFLQFNNIGSCFLELINPFDFEKLHLSKVEKLYLANDNYSRNSRFILGDGTLKLQAPQLAASGGISPNDYLKKNPVSSQMLEAKIKIAIQNEYDELIKRGIEEGANINEKYNGNTLLIYSVRNEKLELTKFLIDHGADLEVPDEYDYTPLLQAAAARVEDGISAQLQLLVEKGANINAKDRYGRSVLQSSIQSNNPEVVKFLIDYGADLESTDNRGETALFNAVGLNNPTMVQLLIDHGANLEVKNEYGKTLLDVARRHRHIETMILNALAKKNGAKEL